MRFRSSVQFAVAVGLVVAPAVGGATKARGPFATLPAATDFGLGIEGIAQIKRTGDGTAIRASVRGLEPGTTYAAHLYNARALPPTPAWAITRAAPTAGAFRPNELWGADLD